jgi:hypothetical protein
MKTFRELALHPHHSKFKHRRVIKKPKVKVKNDKYYSLTEIHKMLDVL